MPTSIERPAQQCRKGLPILAKSIFMMKISPEEKKRQKNRSSGFEADSLMFFFNKRGFLSTL